MENVPILTRVAQMIDRWRQREAVVTAVQGALVQVHVAGEDAPRIAWYRCTMAMPEVGMTGVLFPLKREREGLLVVDAVPDSSVKVEAAGAFVGTAYSSGDTTLGTPALVLDGLVPSAMYQVKMDGQIIAQGSGGAATGSFGFNINGATPTPYGSNVTLPITRGAYPLAWGGAFAADANGEISVKARVVCDSGTIWVDAVYLTAILVDQ